MQLFTFLLEDGRPLSTGHCIRLDGIHAGAFAACPTILWGHTRKDRPIGRGTRLWVEDGRLLIEVELASADLCPTSEVVRWLLRSGRVQYVSGWYASADHLPNAHGGVDVHTCELVEVSILEEPYNPRARLISPVPDPTTPRIATKWVALSERHNVFDGPGLARWVQARPCVVDGLPLGMLGWATAPI